MKDNEAEIDRLILEYTNWMNVIKESISKSYMKRIKMFNPYSYDFCGDFPTALNYIMGLYDDRRYLNYLYGLKHEYYNEIERQTAPFTQILVNLYLMKPIRIEYNSSNQKLIDGIIEKKE